jgi:hypothetical protein
MVAPFPPILQLLTSKDAMDSDTSMRDSGFDTDYTSDMESITSSTYAHTYGKRRSECSSLIAIIDSQIPRNAE